MKTFAANEKRSAPTIGKVRSDVHHPMGPAQQAQQAEIRRILRSTGAQAKLTIGQPNDKYKQEADRVADHVMAMPDPKLQSQPYNEEEEETLQTKPLADQITPLVQRQIEPQEEEEKILQTKPVADQITPLVQRQEEPPEEEEESVQAKFKDGEMIQRVCSECEEELAQRQPMEEEEEVLQAKSKAGETPAVTPSFESRINSLKGGGQPLDLATRAFFEPRFGHDFSQVRVHTSSQATDNAKALNAQAFTAGRNIVFSKGKYAPETTEGKLLIGHELTHVVQQTENSRNTGIISPSPGPGDPPIGNPGKYLGRYPIYIPQENAPPILVNFHLVEAIEGTWLSAVTRELGWDAHFSKEDGYGAYVEGIIFHVNKPPAKKIFSLKHRRIIEDFHPDRIRPGERFIIMPIIEPKPEPITTVTRDKKAKPSVFQMKCEPEPKTLDEVSKIGGSTDILGYTKAAPIRLKLYITSEKGKCKLTITAEPRLSFKHLVYTKAGDYKIGTVIIPFDLCKGKVGDLYYRITPKLADKIKQGEIEHCEDNKLAFTLSYERYVKAVKKVAGMDFSGKDVSACQAEVLKRLKAQTDIDVSNWKPVADCLLDKTLERDNKKWHEVKIFSGGGIDANKVSKFILDPSCSSLTLELDHTKLLNEVGKHPPKDVVKDCGEK